MTMLRANDDRNFNLNNYVMNNDTWNNYKFNNRISREFDAAMLVHNVQCFNFSCSYEIRNES